jgi:hypothetical protein
MRDATAQATTAMPDNEPPLRQRASPPGSIAPRVCLASRIGSIEERERRIAHERRPIEVGRLRCGALRKGGQLCARAAAC